MSLKAAPKTLWFLAVLLALYGTAQGATQSRQNLQQLKLEARAFLQQHYAQQSPGSARQDIEVSTLDPRLRLAACREAIEFELRDTGSAGGAVSVKTSCHDDNPWTVYLGAQVDLYRDILVTASALQRGHILKQSDLTQQALNTSTLRQGYLVDTKQAVGQQLRRPLRAGEALRAGVLEQPLSIKRGEVVTLESSNGAIAVSTQAEALGSGRVGEQIRVRNLSSKRVIRAQVLGKGRVGANF